jgi:hypothetical protein
MNRILKVQDDCIRSGLSRFGKALRTVPRNEQVADGKQGSRDQTISVHSSSPWRASVVVFAKFSGASGRLNCASVSALADQRLTPY